MAPSRSSLSATRSRRLCSRSRSTSHTRRWSGRCSVAAVDLVALVQAPAAVSVGCVSHARKTGGGETRAIGGGVCVGGSKWGRCRRRGWRSSLIPRWLVLYHVRPSSAPGMIAYGMADVAWLVSSNKLGFPSLVKRPNPWLKQAPACCARYLSFLGCVWATASQCYFVQVTTP